MSSPIRGRQARILSPRPHPLPPLSSEECCDPEESPGSLQPSETSSNGAVDDSGSLWSSPSATGGSCQGSVGQGSGVNYQESARRCSQRKKSDMLLLGCASLLASVALGQDLLQLGKLQVRPEGTWESSSEHYKFRRTLNNTPASSIKS